MSRMKAGDIETSSIGVRCFDADMTSDEYQRLPKHSLYIILDNLRSAFNVGAIFRTCDAMRVSGLFLCGYTACPPHLKLQKTSMNTVDFVPWKQFRHTIDAVSYLKEQNIPVWAAETTTRSKPFYKEAVPASLGIVFGNEALGVSPDVLEICDNLIEIPMYGFKNSLNVAASCAVIGMRIIETMAEIKKATAPIAQ